MDDHRTDRAQDYTAAFVWSLYPLLVMALIAIWGNWGYVAALAVCIGLHCGVCRLGLRRARAEADWDARVQAALARARR